MYYSPSNNSTIERRAHFSNNINELYNEDEEKEGENNYYKRGGGGESINYKLQALNILHAVFGAIGLGLAGTQFQPKIGIDNYRQIDLRMASSLIYTITGTVGFYCVNRSHGSIVIKCLYCLNALFALGTSIFYGFTTFKIINLHNQINGRFEQISSIIQFTPLTNNINFIPKILISSSMSIISLIIFLLSLISLALLDRLVAIENIWYPAWPNDRIKAKFNQTLLFGCSFVKLLTAISCLGMSAFVEFEHTQITLRQNYFRLVLDQLSSLFGIGSALVDFYAIYNKTHKTLNLKVSIGLSLIVAIWCLKSVDNNSFPFYKEDINAYRTSFSSSQSSFSSIINPQYIIFIIHGILIILMAILSLICACTCILASSCLRESVIRKDGENNFNFKRKKRILSFFFSLWSLLLLCLLGIGLAELPWTGDYIGSDLFWLAILLFCTGLLNSTYRQRNSIIIKFILNAFSFSVCAEKALLSCWFTIQSFTYKDYSNEIVFDKRSRLGQSLLFGIQTIVLFSAFLTSFFGLKIFGSLLFKQKQRKRKYGILHFCCSLSAIFYAFTIIGSEIFFEIDKWYWGVIDLEQNQFYRLGNGLLGFTVFIIQIICLSNNQFLLPTVFLQIILSSLALFTLNSTITNTYYLQILFNNLSNESNNKQYIILIISLCFAGISVIACSLQIIFGTICILCCSYLLHHGNSNNNKNSQFPSVISYCTTTTTSPIDNNTFNRINPPPGSSFISPPSPELHQFSIRPIEEQTVYWSADENPYIYKSTKRIFDEPIFGGLPYNIDNPNENYYNVGAKHLFSQEGKYSKKLSRYNKNIK